MNTVPRGGRRNRRLAALQTGFDDLEFSKKVGGMVGHSLVVA